MALSNRLRKAVDTLVGILSPRAAYERAAYRRAESILARNSYEGAEYARPRSAWMVSPGSADADLLHDLPQLRERSRDLIRNDGHANAAVQAFLDNVVGQGLRPQAQIAADELGMDPEKAEVLNRQIERYWHLWCKEAAADDRSNFAELQAIVLEQVCTNGDVLALPLMLDEVKERRTFSLAVELVEADRLDDPWNINQKFPNKTIRGGVELGPRGQPVAYWIADAHPGDATMAIKLRDQRKFVRYAARNSAGRQNVLHLFMQRRPGQSRGIPLLAPVLNAFKDVKDYAETELVASKVAACFATFVKNSNPLIAAQARATGQSGDGLDREQELSPGAIYYLRPGEDVSTATPGRPNQAFEQFLDRAVVMMGSAIGLPYELMTRDFRKSTYSSARAALLEARRTFLTKGRFLWARFCQPVYEMFVEELVLRGLVNLPDFYGSQDLYTRCRWIGSAWGMIDPDKELKALQLAVNQNFMSKAEVCAMIGGTDWEEVATQRAREKKRDEELEITPAPVAGAAVAVGAGDEEAEESDE